MCIVAIDPGYERMGVAVLSRGEGNKHVLLFSDCWKTSPQIPFPERLHELGTRLEALVKKHKPQALALEKLYFETNQKTAMHVAEVRGMLMYIATRSSLRLYEYTPLQIKVAVTGYGKANKRELTKMIPLLIDLQTTPKHDDEYDAIAVGLTCLASIRR